jgi:hypothetical protein
MIFMGMRVSAPRCSGQLELVRLGRVSARHGGEEASEGFG